MAKNQINIKEESKLKLISAALIADGRKLNTEELINEIIVMLHSAMKDSDEETHLALFGINKTF